MRVEQRVLTAVADEEAVYFDVQRQVSSAFVGAIENHRGMVEGGEIEPSQIHVQVGPLIDLRHASVQNRRSGAGRHQNDRHGYQQQQHNPQHNTQNDAWYLPKQTFSTHALLFSFSDSIYC